MDEETTPRLQRVIRPTARNADPKTWLTESQVRELCEACEGPTAQRDLLVLGFGLLLGLRSNEISYLVWDRVELSAATVLVIGKGVRPAVLALPAALVEMLFAWRGEHARGLGRPVTDEPVVVAYRKQQARREGEEELVPEWGTRIGGQEVRDVVARAGARIGQPQLAPHDLRRSFAGILEADGVPITEISKALRHSNVGITERYLQDNPARVQEQEEVLASVTELRSAEPES